MVEYNYKGFTNTKTIIQQNAQNNRFSLQFWQKQPEIFFNTHCNFHVCSFCHVLLLYAYANTGEARQLPYTVSPLSDSSGKSVTIRLSEAGNLRTTGPKC